MKKATRNLIEWYRVHRILYPWRQTADPYRIWVSEILLQQTRIPVALPFYERIVERFPSFQDLAAADPDEFLAAWSGIGYYRRAENMIACAKQVVQEHGGAFPADLPALLKLPGIGIYTAGAIKNLCFGELTPAIDGNIGRVLARLTGCSVPMSGREFRRKMSAAFMEYGAGVA
ncbi:MAG TPA: A/G-specific adenine glycosylase, partial [Acidobacteriota bacterium]|nr:A/G-specific adenine glycosylase [Acidobacteriota bacterium]